MGNDVQSHESVVERAPGGERRANPRHAASALGSVSARIIGGSPVELVNFSSRGVLFECDSRLLIGARASVRITTTDANLIVTGRVVRSRVKGLVNGALRYDAALALDTELALPPVVTEAPVATAATYVEPEAQASDDGRFESGDIAFESEVDIDGMFDPAPVEAYLAESDAALAEVAGVAEPAADPEPEPEAEPELAVSVSVAALEPELEAAFEPTFEPETEPEAEPEPEPMVAAAAVHGAPIDVEPEPAVVEAAADEPIAFEADAEIAFEPAGDFEFEAMPEAALDSERELMAAAPYVAAPVLEPGPQSDPEPDPEPASMFDATYVPQVVEQFSSASQFELTPPSPVHAGSSASTFDASPSQTYDGAQTVDDEPTPFVEAEAEAVHFESEIAFEAEDTVVFESVFEADGVEAHAVAAPPPLPPAAAIDAEYVVDAAETVDVAETVEVEVAEVAVFADAVEPMPSAEIACAAGDIDAVEAIEPTEPIDGAEAIDAPADLPVPGAATDERTLLHFSATVPHDLAELRRIAADNQW